MNTFMESVLSSMVGGVASGLILALLSFFLWCGYEKVVNDIAERASKKLPQVEAPVLHAKSSAGPKAKY